MIFIRTDANGTIGMGHLMRCMTIGRALSGTDRVVFLLSDGASESAVRSSEFEYRVLGTHYDCISAESELSKVRAVISESIYEDGRIPIVLVDSYHVAADYFSGLRQSAIVAHIDDFPKEKLDIDILINYDVPDIRNEIASLYDGSDTKLLAGTEYVPLREQFCGIRERTRFHEAGDGQCSVLVSGGGGAVSFLPRLLEYGLERMDRNMKFITVVSGYADVYDELKKLESMHGENLTVLKDVENMAQVMEQCSIAVTAAGTVPYECCAAALPAILYSISDDQLADAACFAESGAMLYAGDIRDNEPDVIEKIFDMLADVASSEDKQREMSRRSKELIDGRGASRIARALLRSRETGSFFEITGNTGKRAGENIYGYLTESAGGRNIRYYDSGRSAFAAAIRSISKCSDRRSCLLPVYTCDTVILPFEHSGWDVHYYQLNRQLEPDMESLREAMEEADPSAVLFHTYFGMDTLSEAEPFMEELRGRGITVIEDMTQSLFMTDKAVKRAGYVVGSIRKWMNVPDGGFAISSADLDEDDEEFDGGSFTKGRYEAMTEKGNYLLGKDNAEKSNFLKTNTGSETDRYDMWTKAYKMSDLSRSMAEKIDASQNMRRRAENAAVLDEGLSGLKSVKKVRSISEGETPLYYPVYADDRQALQTMLREHDIYAPVLWPIYPPAERFFGEDAVYQYGHLLALPCDQRYDVRTMKNMVKLISYYDSGKKQELK